MDKKRILIGIFIIIAAVFLFEIYLPKSFAKSPMVYYSLQKGMGYSDVANDLQKQGIIRHASFLKFYAIVSRNYAKLQAGNYEVSQSMSVADIVGKFISGDVVKNTITVIEGWNAKDLATYLEDKKLYTKKDFTDAIKSDFSSDFPFLKEKPKGLGLEGYIFPDTYYVGEKATAKDFLKITLANFDKKLSPELRQEIARQHKSIFDVITMASILEKEVKSLDDKKIVAGILWKRINEGVPLQVDATVNYATGKSDKKVALKDTQINSPYNTYKYYGLPLGPISNPGMESILAAVYPKKTNYWYYLSADGTGKTIFSKTLEEHNTAIAKYFKNQ